MAKVIAVDLEVNTEKAQKATAELTGSLDKLSGGAISGFKAMRASLTTVTAAFKTMRGAIIATGLGALVVVLASLKTAFTSSEEGQNKWNKILTITGALVGNLVDLLADFGELIIKVFTEPTAVLSEFSHNIKKYVTNQIKIVTEGLGLLGSAIKKTFSGDFKGAANDAAEGLKKLYIEANPTVQAIKALTEATKEFTKEQLREAEAAAKVADMRAEADKIERDLLVERSKLESQIAELRLKSRQEDQFTAQERRQALLDAQELEDQLLIKETEYLELRRDAQVLENTFSRSNKENLDKEAQAIAAVNRQTATRLNNQRQVQRELNRLNGELEREQQLLAKTKEDDAARRLEVRVTQEKEIGLAINKQALQNAEAQIKIEQDAADKKAKLYEEDRIRKEQNILNAANTILGINSLFEGKTEAQQKKAFKRTKALNIASATVETFLAAQKAFTSQIIPLDPTSPVRGALAAAAAIASGLARVAQIKKQKFNGGGGGGSSPITIGGGSSGGGGNGSAGIGFNPSTPTISALPNFATTQAQNNNSGSNVRAYVIQDDINSQTALNKRINQRTKL